ncbi:MAG: ABC transporter permease [Euryarchaeota archaeon]|nr:ABC transporter permease [Euryarchaeota archaeon]
MSLLDWAIPVLFLVGMPLLVVVATAGFDGMRPAVAIMRRRLQVYTSYPFAVFATLLHGVVLVVLVATIGAYLFPDLRDFTIGRDGGVRFITYLTVGLIAWPTIWEGYEITQRNVRSEQTTGIFETLIATPVGVRVLPLAYLLISFPVAIVIGTVAYFLFTHFGGVGFPISGPVQVLNVVLVLATGVFMTWGLGLFLGGLTALYKETGPLGGLLKMLMLVFSNVYIPINVFPAPFQVLSTLLPLTWAFASIRDVFAGGTVVQHMGTYLVFLGYTIAIVLAGLWVFERSIDRARQDGTTGSY